MLLITITGTYCCYRNINNNTLHVHESQYYFTGREHYEYLQLNDEQYRELLKQTLFQIVVVPV